MDRVYMMELVRARQCDLITRREFMQRATLALGSASAAGLLLSACTPNEGSAPPAVVEPQASATTAEESGMEGEAIQSGNIEYEDEQDGETLSGFLARPSGEGSWPGVLVIQEWWGMNDHIRDVTERLAAEGFVALAPDLYHGVVVSEPDEARKLVMALDMAEAVREIQLAVGHLLAQPNVAGEEIGVLGFCMGGRLALQSALAEPRLGAVVAFYGTPLAPEESPGMQAPVLGLYGSADQGIPVPQVRAMEQALAGAGIEHEIQVYEGAGHAFFNDTRSSYNAEAAQDAWARTLAWLQDHLG